MSPASRHVSADFRSAECFCVFCAEPLDGVLDARVPHAGQPSVAAEKLAEAEQAMAAALNDGSPALAATAASGLGHAGLRSPLQLPEGTVLPSSQPNGSSTNEASADKEAALSEPVEMQTGALLLRLCQSLGNALLIVPREEKGHKGNHFCGIDEPQVTPDPRCLVSFPLAA